MAHTHIDKNTVSLSLSLSHTVCLSVSLSLSHTHTHTNTDRQRQTERERESHGVTYLRPSTGTYLDRSQNKRVCRHATGKAKVAQFDNAPLSQQNVLWLHVAVQNAVRVQIKQSRHQLGCDCLNLSTTKKSKYMIACHFEIVKDLKISLGPWPRPILHY